MVSRTFEVFSALKPVAKRPRRRSAVETGALHELSLIEGVIDRLGGIKHPQLRFAQNLAADLRDELAAIGRGSDRSFHLGLFEIRSGRACACWPLLHGRPLQPDGQIIFACRQMPQSFGKTLRHWWREWYGVWGDVAKESFPAELAAAQKQIAEGRTN